jgi:chorismate mutase/prephenate dehydratase
MTDNNTLESLRNEINNIDDQIIKLFDQRMDLCKKVGIFKKHNNIEITHYNREAGIINRLSNKIEINNLTNDDIKILYEIIFKISKSKQK